MNENLLGKISVMIAMQSEYYFFIQAIFHSAVSRACQVYNLTLSHAIVCLFVFLFSCI